MVNHHHFSNKIKLNFIFGKISKIIPIEIREIINEERYTLLLEKIEKRLMDINNIEKEKATNFLNLSVRYPLIASIGGGIIGYFLDKSKFFGIILGISIPFCISAISLPVSWSLSYGDFNKSEYIKMVLDDINKEIRDIKLTFEYLNGDFYLNY